MTLAGLVVIVHEVDLEFVVDDTVVLKHLGAAGEEYACREIGCYCAFLQAKGRSISTGAEVVLEQGHPIFRSVGTVYSSVEQVRRQTAATFSIEKRFKLDDFRMSGVPEKYFQEETREGVTRLVGSFSPPRP